MLSPLMQLRIVRGAEAHAMLENQAFQAQWSRLCEQCPWATAFQSLAFVSAWYDTYLSRYEPLLVFSRDHEDTINGLLPLGVASDDGQLVVAGGGQAEYQSWICPPELGDQFAWEAIQSLQRDFPLATLTFRYLPPGTPTGWLSSREAVRICRLEPHRRPLLRLGDGEDIAKSLKKKSHRFNRLKKLGSVDFKVITNAVEFEQLFDSIIEYYDFRQASLHGVAPFRDDLLKREFHVAMMRSPGLLHVSTLSVGGQLAAAHIGTRGNREVHLGILAHSPSLSRHSPGQLLMLRLAQALWQEGYEQFDLTPGDEAYKSNFGNASDQVHVLAISPSRRQRWKARLRESIERGARKSLKRVHISPSHVKALLRKFKRIHPVRTPANLQRSVREWIYRRREMRVYSYDAANVHDMDGPGPIRRDALDDLLDFRPLEAWQSRQHFFSLALDRIEKGFRVYTYAENGRLLHYGWLIERQEKSLMSEVGQEFTFPPNSACLFDFYTTPEARGRGLYTLSLKAMLQDAARIAGTEKIFIAVLADNMPSRHVIEKVGFVYRCSLFEEIRFGRARRWTHTQEQASGAGASHGVRLSSSS